MNFISRLFRNIKMSLKKRKKLIFILFLAIVIMTFAINKIVSSQSKGIVYDEVSKIPHNKVGLVLGTSKFLSNGQVNLYYQYRIDAVFALYKAQKIDYILISGDNSNPDYDEPNTFKMDLIALGIPVDKIFLDYAGFRTLDSVVRAKLIFGQSSFTIISQKFHNERAIYIAHHNHINAIGFNAQGVTKRYGFKTHMREYLARVKMVLDLTFEKQPKFLGEKIIIPDSN
jgi:SanA protein